MQTSLIFEAFVGPGSNSMPLLLSVHSRGTEHSRTQAWTVCRSYSTLLHMLGQTSRDLCLVFLSIAGLRSAGPFCCNRFFWAYEKNHFEEHLKGHQSLAAPWGTISHHCCWYILTQRDVTQMVLECLFHHNTKLSSCQIDNAKVFKLRIRVPDGSKIELLGFTNRWVTVWGVCASQQPFWMIRHICVWL